MIKYLTTVLWLFWSATGLAHDANYYKNNPNKLEEAITSCSVSRTNGLNCDELKKIALRVNELSYEIRVSPQGFGQKILMLEEAILSPMAQQSDISSAREELQERLAIVKWLESPEG